jgi:hypothetical protein
MVRTRCLLIAALLAGMASLAGAQDFGLDIGSLSDPLTGAPVFVNGNGGGADGYFNSLDTLITELSFQVNAGLGKQASDFNCIAFSFFVCSTPIYNSTTGIVTFDFNAVNPPDGDEGPFDTDNEGGPEELEGLPTLLNGCLAHPDTGFSTVLDGNGNPLPCTFKGHFLISFNNFGGGIESPPTFNGDPNGTGGWAPGTVAALATVNGRSVPEPFSSALLGLGLALTWGAVRRKSARRSRS